MVSIGTRYPMREAFFSLGGPRSSPTVPCAADLARHRRDLAQPDLAPGRPHSRVAGGTSRGGPLSCVAGGISRHRRARSPLMGAHVREAGTEQECGGRLAPQEHGCWGRRLCRHHSLRHGSTAAGPGKGRSSTVVEAMDVPALVGGEDAAAGASLGLGHRRGFTMDSPRARPCGVVSSQRILR